jgi:molybdopterin converting factor small subunit
MPSIRIPSQLRTLTGGAADISTSAPTVRAALADLERTHPGVSARLFDARGSLLPFIRLFVGGEDIGALRGLDTELGPRDELAIVPAIAGGQ